MAERAQATIEEVPASHGSLVVAAGVAARLILRAVEATNRGQP